MTEPEQSAIDAVVAELNRLVAASSASEVCATTGISRTSFDRIRNTVSGQGAGFNTNNLELLFRHLPECRVAAIRALQGSEARDSEWSLIAGQIGRVLSSAHGWRLYHALSELVKADRLLEGIAAMEGVVAGVSESERSHAAARKSKRDKAKRESS